MFQSRLTANREDSRLTTVVKASRSSPSLDIMLRGKGLFGDSIWLDGSILPLRYPQNGPNLKKGLVKLPRKRSAL
jgi:hypothetical protein